MESTENQDPSKRWTINIESSSRKLVINKFKSNTDEDEYSQAYSLPSAIQIVANGATDHSDKNDGSPTMTTKELFSLKYPDMVNKLTPKALLQMELFMEELKLGFVEQIVEVYEQKQQNHSKNDTKDTNEDTITSDMINQAALTLMGARESELAMSKSEVISNYFGVVDEAVDTFQRMLKMDAWVKVKDKSGVVISKRQLMRLPGETPSIKHLINCVKGEGTISSSPDSIKEVILDFENMPKWDPLCEEVSLVERIDNHTAIVHMKFSTRVCILVQKRDFVVIVHWHQFPDGSIMVVGRSVAYDKIPPQTSYMRGEVFASGYLLVPQNNEDGNEQTLVTYLSHTNVKSILNEYIAAQFMNKVQELQPLNVAHLRQRVLALQHV